MSKTVIIAIVITAILLLVLIGVLIWFFAGRGRRFDYQTASPTV